ncbi:unnamed protein product [Enterobius vermicularis]|uniref:NGFI-A-binding protein homolog n=1 Tax=Enterobius vermicularis TaxID=51028 RepID=A0A0N4VMZ6_ENTVE|nr:unnamed protein product [Enterobius vermicularis]
MVRQINKLKCRRALKKISAKNSGYANLNIFRPAGRQPTNFSEWQLLAVLHRANLLQYYDDFIAQGGDDINQFMTCDEHEFLEIMSVVGMASKPLHVRRFQRTLTEFSKDPDAFNLLAIQQIGVPPMGPYTVSSPSTAALNPATALQFLMSTSGLGLAVAASLPNTSPSTSVSSSFFCTDFIWLQTLKKILTTESVLEALTTSVTSTSVGATANVLAGDYLTSLVGVPPTTTSSVSSLNNHDSSNVPTTTIATLLSSTNHSSATPHSVSTSPGNTDTSYNDYDLTGINSTTETPVLTDAQIGKLAQCSIRLIERMPQLEPKLTQNKKKISRELLDVMQLPVGSPQRLQEYRKYSAIYGRFDAKRKPDKPLTLHEVSVNEAAAQLCLRQPALLTRRDELFPLARQVVKDAGYNYVKGLKKSDSEIRKRLTLPSDNYTSEPSQSPRSSVSDGLVSFSSSALFLSELLILSPPPTEEYTPDSGGEVVSSVTSEVGNSRKRRHQDSLTENTGDSNSSLLLTDRWGPAKKASDCSLDDNS